MKMRVCLLVMCMVCGMAAYAFATQKVYLQLLQAKNVTVERDGQMKNELQFLIVWKNIDIPAMFYWRGVTSWVPCNMAKMHRTGSKKNPVYTFEDLVYPDVIHRGDTLRITTVSGGKHRVPAEIYPNEQNMLCFKSGGSNWIEYPVGKVERK